MAQLADNHALLIYRIGPVLCCAPTDPVESLISPPPLTRPPGRSNTYPGIFRHDGKLVSLVEMRQLFGVEEQSRKNPGRIAICQLDGRHLGFLVDEVIDVIDTPASGWGQLAPSLSGGVFTRSLLLNDTIHLYAEFEKLHKIRNTGFLKPWLEKLYEKEKLDEKTLCCKTDKQHTLTNVTPITGTAGVVNTATTTTHTTCTPAPTKTKNESTATIASSASSSTKPDAEGIEPVTSPPATTGTDSQIRLPPSQPAKRRTHTQITSAAIQPEKCRQSRNASDSEKAQTTAAITSVSARSPAPPQPSINRPPITTVSVSSQVSVSEKNPLAKADTRRSPAPNTIPSTTPESAHPATTRSEVNNDSLTTVRENENKPRSGLFFFTLILLGLVSALGYLWPNLNPDSGKIVTDNTLVEAAKPAYQQAHKLSPIAIEPALSQNTPNSKLLQGEPGDYHAAIEQQTKEHGTHEVTIILSAPADDNVIRENAGTRLAKESQSPVINLEITPATTDPPVDEYTDPNLKKITHPATAQSINEVLHIVVRGDTLWHIAQRYIHNPFRYPELARLNKIQNPDLIYPSDQVRIIRIRPQPRPASTD